jgi:hypothetical protein
MLLRLTFILSWVAIGVTAGSVWEPHGAVSGSLISSPALEQFRGGCSSSCTEKGDDGGTRCNVAGGTNPCGLIACTKSGGMCVGAALQDNNTCIGAPGTCTDCAQTNNGNCGTVMTGPIPPSGSCLGACPNSGSGCGATHTSTTVTTCSS